jgi:hypothetical protein
LRSVFDAFAPDFCFNLHDQRTIFSAGSNKNSAVLSFLSPAQDTEKTVTNSRKLGMRIIADISKELHPFLPNNIGRYDDGFNPNCVGDTFQAYDVPTILFEAGHFPEDYDREQVREFLFYALLAAICSIYRDHTASKGYEAYFDIPENEKRFTDLLLQNVRVSESALVDLAIQYREQLRVGVVRFSPELVAMGSELDLYGHKELDCEHMIFQKSLSSSLIVGKIIDYLTFDNENLIKKLKIQ